ncbi:MAG: MBL fold metallo-hydrolase [Suipraeoptans sp.]
MKVEIFQVGLAGANCYFVINENTNEAVVIDPGGMLTKMEEFIKTSKITIKAILLTHGHFDHIMGIDEILKYGKAPVYILDKDSQLLTNADLNASISFLREGYTYNGAINVEDAEVLHPAGFDFEVIATPGHTRGSCCFYIRSEGVLFSGDTLFYESIGRTDLAGGGPDIYQSIKNRLFTLSEETIVYPGHNNATTIGHEIAGNPFIH